MNKLASLLFATLLPLAVSQAADISRYNVVWNSPSKDATGVMPIGNGDIAAGVYAIENGDLFLLLAKNDAYNYLGDIIKTGRVRVSLKPNPFETGKPFRQTLDLATGSIRIEADGVTMRIWADANRPAYHIEIDSPHDVAVTAQPEFWQRFDNCAHNGVKPTAEPPQDVRVERNGKILWYYSVGERSVYPDDLKHYEVEHMAASFPDPYRFNTFGNLLESPMLKLADRALRGTGKTFDIRIHALTMQTPEPETWIAAIEKQTADAASDWEKHRAWWTEFWKRSWITCSDNTVPAEARERLNGEVAGDHRVEEDGAAVVAQSYNVFRFLMACQSRGRVQAKFNGGLFTQQLRVPNADSRTAPTPQADGTFLTHEDDRLWGRRFTYQNQRLLYWPLLANGDFEMMKPFFDYYSNLLPMRQAITKAWFGHDGAYYRDNIEPTGAERDCGEENGKPPKTKPGENKGQGFYHSYYFTSGLETTAMMLDYVNFTGDTAFRDKVLVPFAREVLLFFDKHYSRGPDGKLRIDPAMVLETWWIAVNPAPDVAGLQFCLDELLAMKAGTAGDQAQWSKFRAEIPELHMRTIDGCQSIAPALSWDKLANSENGELYPVFPFRRFGVALGSADIVAETMKHRTSKDAFGCICWTQDQIHWACAGNASEAARGLVRRFRSASSMCRFPLYGRESPDSCPDFDHFGSGSVALQRMLVQEAGGKIFLLPAWPATWDTDFKLHLSQRTVISGTVKDGKLVSWDIQPASRKKDVTVCQPQAVPAIPGNNHPLRAGSDQMETNKFAGAIGRVSMFRGKLSPHVIRDIAADDRSKALDHSLLNPKPGEVLPTTPEDFAGAVTFEAWIFPAEKEVGRILDKLTAGNNDGFLWDTHPGLSLRVISGSQSKLVENALKPSVWQHVAVVLDQGAPRLYLNGQALD